eukprot:1847475-Rhodomonas_salina.3
MRYPVLTSRMRLPGDVNGDGLDDVVIAGPKSAIALRARYAMSGTDVAAIPRIDVAMPGTGIASAYACYVMPGTEVSVSSTHGQPLCAKTYTPKSNARNHIPGTNCTEIAFLVPYGTGTTPSPVPACAKSGTDVAHGATRLDRPSYAGWYKRVQYRKRPVPSVYYELR